METEGKISVFSFLTFLIIAMIKLINTFNNYSRAILKRLVPSFVGMLRVKAGRPLVNHMLNMVLLVRGSITNSLVKVIVSYVRFLYVLNKQNGSAFTAKYLKAATSLLMQSISGKKHKSSQEMGLAVSRTRRGLPRFIPAIHRSHIRQGNVFYIRLWLTLLSVYRVLDFTGPLSIKTIVTPVEAVINFDEVKWAVHDLRIKDKVRSPSGVLIPFWISSSSPTSTKVIRDGDKVILPSSYSTSISAMIKAAYAWAQHPELLRAYLLIAKTAKLTGPVVQFMDFVLFCRGSFKLPFTLCAYEANYKKVTLVGSWLVDSISLGKLGFKVEPAGKIRVFAMVDCFTQWLMKPFHDSLFGFLQTLNTDATFDQSASVKSFAQYLYDRKITNIYSFDLTAATDKIPVSVQSVIMTHAFWMHGLGDAWKALLVDRWYDLPSCSWDPSAGLARRLGFDPTNLPDNVRCTMFNWKDQKQSFVTSVRYAVGQPMGALSSWAMLAVTHHCMVAIAARRVGMIGFEGYRVLGDDLVIADDSVAQAYLALCSEWGVGINLSKSVISNNGSFEFAKRFYFKYQDVSGLSFKEMSVAKWDIRALLQMFLRISGFRNIRVSELLSFLGHGYKALSRIDTVYSKMGNGMRRALFLVTYPGLPFSKFHSHEDWLKSKAYNQSSSLVFPKEAKEIIVKAIIDMAGKIPPYKLPSKSMNFLDLIHSFVGFDTVTTSTIDPLTGKPMRELKPHTRYIKGDFLDKKRKEPYEPFIMQFAWAFKPLFDILWEHFNKILTDLRSEYRSHRHLMDMDLTNLWLSYDRIESVSKDLANLSEYRTIKDVQTLGNSKILKHAFNVRKTIMAFSKESR